jgi:hypothetical protein
MSKEIGRVIVSFVVEVSGARCSFVLTNWPFECKQANKYAN